MAWGNRLRTCGLCQSVTHALVQIRNFGAEVMFSLLPVTTKGSLNPSPGAVVLCGVPVRSRNFCECHGVTLSMKSCGLIERKEHLLAQIDQRGETSITMAQSCWLIGAPRPVDRQAITNRSQIPHQKLHHLLCAMGARTERRFRLNHLVRGRFFATHRQAFKPSPIAGQLDGEA